MGGKKLLKPQTIGMAVTKHTTYKIKTVMNYRKIRLSRKKLQLLRQLHQFSPTLDPKLFKPLKQLYHNTSEERASVLQSDLH